MSNPDPIKAIRDMATGYAARNMALPSLLRDLIAAADKIEGRQVEVAIAVLRSYTAGTLQTDLCDELDEQIEKAFNVLSSKYDDNNEPW